MKNTLLLCLAVGAISLSALFLNAPGTHAQQADLPIISPTIVQTNPAVVQYKVLDIGRFAVAQGQTADSTLEVILNNLGTQGWRVTTTTGTFIILMR